MVETRTEVQRTGGSRFRFQSLMTSISIARMLDDYCYPVNKKRIFLRLDSSLTRVFSIFLWLACRWPLP